VVLLVSVRGALEQSITTTLGWDQHLAAAKDEGSRRAK
jgi:hypothetical protein